MLRATFPIQRQGITEFADHDVHDQGLGRHPAVDRPCRRLGDHDDTLAGATGIARAARHSHPQLHWRDVELLGAQFADAMHAAAHGQASGATSITTS